MTIIVDANVLLRLAQRSSSLHPVAKSAVLHLQSQGEALGTVPQAIYEFWVAATRPLANNGLELSVPECEVELARLESVFQLFDDQPSLYTTWRGLVTQFVCHGKVAHDTRYVAALQTHHISHLLTFNVSDFNRYSALTILDPRVVANQAGQIDASPTK